jgi:F-type H+-transporting ATPase subunit delta
VAQTGNGGASEAAERYAQAAFELARDGKQLEVLEKDFATFEAAMKASADLASALASPLISPEDKARALVAVAKKLGLSELGCNLIGTVAKNGRAFEIAGVAQGYRALLAKHRGARRVEIVSARPLEKKQVDDIVAALIASQGGAFDVVTRVDEGLIGGFVVRAGSRQFDASLKSKLDSLKLALKTA